MGKAKPAGARRQAPKAPAKTSPNPFEVKVNRQKFQILGRKTRHDVGLPGVSRARAIRKVRDPAGTWVPQGLLRTLEPAAAFSVPQVRHL